MIPGNQISPAPEVSGFLPPYNIPYTPLSQVVPGGIAIGDPSKGRLYQNWVVSYAASQITVRPVNGAVEFSLPVASVFSVSLAFDNNMGMVLSWQNAVGSNLYYFDTVMGSYTTRVFSGTTSCRVVVDNSNDYYLANSDVIFGYTYGGNLYWRQQRDRYDVERLVGPTNKRLIKMAPSLVNRLQFELR